MSLAKNSLLYILSTISIKAASFFLLPFYSYLITPEEYGYVYVTSAFTTFMSLFIVLSLNGAIQRFFFECSTEAEVKKMYSNITGIVTVFVIGIGGGLLFCKEWISELIGLPILYFDYAVYISIISAYYPLILALLYASEKAKQVSLTSIFLGVIGIVIQLILVLHKQDKALALIQTMLYNAILSFCIFLVYSKKYLTIPRFRIKECVEYIKYSLSQWPSSISVWFISFSDRLLLNRIQGARDTGIYGMGSTLGQIPQMLFHSVNKAYVPYVFRHYKDYEKNNASAINNIVIATTKLISILIGIITILIVLSNNIVNILAPRFQESAYIMPLILIAVFIDCNRIIFMNPLSYNLKYVKIKSAIWVFAAACNIALNIMLIPKYSAIGACVSCLISYSITLIFILYFANKAMPIRYERKKLCKIIGCSSLFALGYFAGDKMQSLVIKMPLILVYVYILVKLNNIQLKQIMSYVKVFSFK